MWPPGATEATTHTLEEEKLSTWRWTSIHDTTMDTTTSTMAEAETMIHTSTTDMIDTTLTMVTIDRTTNMPKQQKTRQ